MTTISHTETTVATEWVFAISAATAPTESRTLLAVLWENAIDYLVPIGYENETGFHYGEPPA